MKLQWGRGQSAAERNRPGSFVRHAEHASMWPRSIDRGIVAGVIQRLPTALMYLRSRDRGKGKRMDAMPDDLAASMWPRSCDRGKLGAGLLVDQRLVASMWPRSCDRGKFEEMPESRTID